MSVWVEMSGCGVGVGVAVGVGVGEGMIVGCGVGLCGWICPVVFISLVIFGAARTPGNMHAIRIIEIAIIAKMPM